MSRVKRITIKGADIPWDYHILKPLLEWKSRKSRGVTGKFGFGVQNEAGQRLREFCQENTLIIANTFFQQHKRRLYTWTLPDSQY